MASKTRVLYIGITNNLTRRVWEHKNDMNEGFTKRYRCHELVYYEVGPSSSGAIDREKQLKKWSRQKKALLVSNFNPMWEDLSDKISQ